MAVKKKEKAAKTPASVTSALKQLSKIKDQTVPLVKQLAKFETKIAALREKIEVQMKKDKLDSVKNSTYGSAYFTKTEYAELDDWNKFISYVVKNKAWDLLTQKVSTTAFRERLAAKKKVAGVSKGTRKTLTVRLK